MEDIQTFLNRVDASRMAADLYYLARDPLPCRALNVTLPGHRQNTLYEADDYIVDQLASWGYLVAREPVPVQAFRRDPSKPLAHQYSPPDPADPWYLAYNLYAYKMGHSHPEELLVLVAHKDSQSWLDCAAGAYDNGVGTVAVLEIARVLADYAAQRSLWFLFCNEEHAPWTSVVAACKLAASAYRVLGVLNLDGIGAKSAEDQQAGRLTNVTRYSSPEGEALADLMADLNARYRLGLQQSKYYSEHPNDDDGSFVKAGIPFAVLNIGCMPYAEPYYHTMEDIPAHVDWPNVHRATQLSLAWIMYLDQR